MLIKVQILSLQLLFKNSVLKNKHKNPLSSSVWGGFTGFGKFSLSLLRRGLSFLAASILRMCSMIQNKYWHLSILNVMVRISSPHVSDTSSIKCLEGLSFVFMLLTCCHDQLHISMLVMISRITSWSMLAVIVYRVFICKRFLSLDRRTQLEKSNSRTTKTLEKIELVLCWQ